MGRRKKEESVSEPPRDEPAEQTEDGAVEAPPPEEPPKKKRGRPKKSKAPRNKAIEGMLAQAPLALANSLSVMLAGRVLLYDADAVAACQSAFSEWLDAMDVQLGPGVALMLAYGAALSTGVLNNKPVSDPAVASAMGKPTEPAAPKKDSEPREVAGERVVRIHPVDAGESAPA